MNGLFIGVLNMSLTASAVIAVVLLARLCLSKAPKVFSYVLWSVVLFRLLCPVSLSLPVSVPEPVAEASVPTGAGYTASMEYISLPEQPGGDIPAEGERPEASEASSSGVVVEPRKMSAGESALAVLGWLWAAGAAVMLIAALRQAVSLRRMLADACVVRENIFESDKLNTAFVFGLLRPRIYLPLGLPSDIRETVIAHEQTHRRRGDHIVKLLFCAALALHWFNPLVWLAFRMMTEDMEKSCDEAVIRAMKKHGHSEKSVKKDYSQMLLALGGGSRYFLSPVSFAGHSVKGRIENVARYRRIGVALSVVLGVVCAAVAAVCLINPGKTSGEEQSGTVSTISATVRTQSDIDAVTSNRSAEKLELTVDCRDTALDFSGLASMENLRGLFVDFVGEPQGDEDYEYKENQNIPLLFAQIGSIPNLTELRCGSQAGWKARGISEYLEKLTRLERLSVTLHRSETSVDFVRGMNELTHLSVLGYASHIDMSAVSGLPSLRSLDIYVCRFDKAAIESISSLERLGIRVDHSECLDGMTFDGMPELRELILLGAGKIDVKSIGGLTELRDLTLNLCPEDGSILIDMAIFSGLDELERIDIVSDAVIVNLDTLKECDTLMKVDIMDAEVSEEELRALASSCPEISVTVSESLFQ